MNEDTNTTFHEDVLKSLLLYRKNHPDFNFIARQRDRNGKFDAGYYFQGTDGYAFVGLIDRSGGVNMTRSVGLVFYPSENNIECHFEIVYKGEKDVSLLNFYQELRSLFPDGKDVEDGQKFIYHIGTIGKKDRSELFNFLDIYYPKIKKLCEQSTLNDLIISNEKFNKIIENITSIMNQSRYWIFQGSAEIYNIVDALKAGHLKSWKVSAHKDKIKEGDKIILWQTGDAAGCYALAEVVSEVGAFKEEAFETQYYQVPFEERDDLRVKLKVIDNAAEEPILWKEIKNAPELKSFKAGNQGTNFSASKEEFTFFKNQIMAKKVNNDVKTSDAKDNINDKTTSSLNQILYGPPGTGKTYKLQSKYFDKFTLKESSLNRDQFLENQVSEILWWQVIAIAVYDLKLASTTDLLNHFLIKAKVNLSTSKNIRALLWSNLQSHTVMKCENVNITQRFPPLVFHKDEKSRWSLVEEEINEAFPEIEETLKNLRNFTPSDNKIIKNYEFVTFHQSFSYEDFVEGIKPKLEEEESAQVSYEIKDGVFKKLALRAKADPDNNYAIFIDEINRGNVSAIFGELITLIEEDKRANGKNPLSVKLPYSKKEFEVPSNLYVFGTMNTADRSVEALDTALRRRFSFMEVMPDPSLLEDIEFNGFNLMEVLETINERIEFLLDRDHTIGHSYFMDLESDDTDGLEEVFKNKVIPLLQEYFYHDYEKIALILGSGFVTVKTNHQIMFPHFDGIAKPDQVTLCELVNDIDDIEVAVLKLLNRDGE